MRFAALRAATSVKPTHISHLVSQRESDHYMKNKIFKFGALVILIVLATIYGILIHKSHYPPYDIIQTVFRYIKVIRSTEYSKTPAEYFENDITALISIKQPQDVSQLRSRLIALLWGRPGLPLSLPSAIANDFVDHGYDDISSLSRTDKLSIVMEFGLDSNVYHFIPLNPNNKVVLYHKGHADDFDNEKEQIKELLDNGYSVFVFDMPLSGLNNQPTVHLPRQGNLKLTDHDHIQFLKPVNGHPVKYFIEPIVIVLNYLKKQFDYSSVSMVGISGGGWATTIAAAIDTRIEKSFPVAGSYPIYLRSNSERDWGDYEQINPEIYNTVNYLELYILGSYGVNRKQLQIINQYDPCCYAGTKWETYKDIVRARVQDLGVGEFDLLSDDSQNQHLISKEAMKRILDELSSRN